MQAPPAFKKRVRWADDVDDEDEDIGFSIGGASRQQVGLPAPQVRLLTMQTSVEFAWLQQAQQLLGSARAFPELQLWVQLETVYVLEGLGPPKDQAAASRTFADQASMLAILREGCCVKQLTSYMHTSH